MRLATDARSQCLIRASRGRNPRVLRSLRVICQASLGVQQPRAGELYYDHWQTFEQKLAAIVSGHCRCSSMATPGESLMISG